MSNDKHPQVEYTFDIVDDAREQLREALDEADAALSGDSNDAEHDALYSVRETIARILGVDYDAPSPDYDAGDDVPMEAALEAARKIGAEHGHAAGTWAFDGNTTAETYAWALQGIRDGDPAVLDGFPSEPHGLGGEYTAENLYDELDLAYPSDRPTPQEADEIAQITEAYEQAARDAFWAEVERTAIHQVEG